MSLTAAQLQARRIGGSDCATVLGLNPYKAPYELWAELTGALAPVDLSDHEAVEAGVIMEPAIAELYTRRTGRRVRKCNRTLVHSKHDWLTAHIDRDVVGERRLLEIKNVSWRLGADWGAPGSDEVADYYLPQCMHYLLVMNYACADVAAYFGGGELAIYELLRDREWDELIIQATHDFWHHHVLSGVPPAMDWAHRSAGDLLKRLYPGTDGSTVELGQGITKWHEIRVEALARARHYQTMAEAARNHIASEMGHASIGLLPDGTGYTRKRVKRRGYAVEDTEYMDFRHAKRVPA